MCNSINSRSLIIFTLWYFKHSICAFHILPLGFSHSQGSNRLRYLVQEKHLVSAESEGCPGKSGLFPQCAQRTQVPLIIELIKVMRYHAQHHKKGSTGPQKMTLINGVSQTAGTFMGHRIVWKHKSCLLCWNMKAFIGINCNYKLKKSFYSYQTFISHSLHIRNCQ